VKVGDLVLFRGSWVRREDGATPKKGVIVKRWFNGRGRKLQTAEIFWDNGETRKVLVNLLEVVGESR
jgi:hypothetical protein